MRGGSNYGRERVNRTKADRPYATNSTGEFLTTIKPLNQKRGLVNEKAAPGGGGRLVLTEVQSNKGK